MVLFLFSTADCARGQPQVVSAEEAVQRDAVGTGGDGEGDGQAVEALYPGQGGRGRVAAAHALLQVARRIFILIFHLYAHVFPIHTYVFDVLRPYRA